MYFSFGGNWSWFFQQDVDHANPQFVRRLEKEVFDHKFYFYDKAEYLLEVEIEEFSCWEVHHRSGNVSNLNTSMTFGTSLTSFPYMMPPFSLSFTYFIMTMDTVS